MKLSQILRERGYVYQHSSETLEEITDGPKRTLYLGVDPTADSMHVGQLMGMLVLRRFVDDGHKLIVVVGGGTGMIGDPGGKSAERNLLDNETVERNSAALRAQFSQLLGAVHFEMVNNAEWLRELNYMEFLRDIGKHFTVNEMIKRDTVRPRLETPDQSISYTEFSYMLLQAYDFLELHKRYDCDLQVGGSDQWGNIISGVDLIRRKTGAKTYALSWPLLTDKAGKKFGKSEGNAIWLDPQKTSPFQFYQFFFNIEDEMVEQLLWKMTMFTKEEIKRIVEGHSSTPGARYAQAMLAQAVTALVHGVDVAREINQLSQKLYSGNGWILDDETRAAIQKLAPMHRVAESDNLLDVLVQVSLATSKREARQFIQDGAISLNFSTVTDVSYSLQASDFREGFAHLRRGKRQVCVLTLS